MQNMKKRKEEKEEDDDDEDDYQSKETLKNLDTDTRERVKWKCL